MSSPPAAGRYPRYRHRRPTRTRPRPQPGRGEARQPTGGRRRTGAARWTGAARRATVRLGGFGAVCAGLAVLSACQKPTPLATVTSGTDSVHAQTACYDHGRQLPTRRLQQCLTGRHKALDVDPDGMARFGVEPAVADQGWTILLNGRPLTDVSHRTYRTIPAAVFFSPQYGSAGSSGTASVLEGNGTKITGLWSFTFRKKP